MEKSNGMPFVFYPSFLDQIDKIKNDAVRLLVLNNIVRYGCYGEKPDFSSIDSMGLLDAAFEPIMSVIDAAKEKYDTNKEIQKLRVDLRWGNITKDEYEARMRSIKEKEIGNTKDATEYHGIPRNTTEYHGKIGNTEDTLNKEKGIRNKEKEINNIDRGQTAKRFTPPSLEDIQAYCSEMGYSFDPQRFLDFYESKGWMVGKTKMKDWKAALRGWNSRQPEFEFKPQQPPSKDARRGTDVSASSGKDYEGDFISSNPQGWDEDDRKF